MVVQIISYSLYMFNLFADPLSPASNNIGIFSGLWLASKLFSNQHTLNPKLEELQLRGIDIEFPYVGGIKRPYNNLSVYAVAIVYPEVCKKYWKDKGKTIENVRGNQKELFDDLIGKIKEARRIYTENHKKLKK